MEPKEAHFLARLARLDALLSQTERAFQASAARIDRQVEIIARIEHAGGDPSRALRTLDYMKGLHADFEQRSRRLFRFIESLTLDVQLVSDSKIAVILSRAMLDSAGDRRARDLHQKFATPEAGQFDVLP